MIHEGGKWPIENVQDGDTFIMVNCCQTKEDSDIFAGKKDLKFLYCNLTNVVLDPSFKIGRSCNVHKARYALVDAVVYDDDENIIGTRKKFEVVEHKGTRYSDVPQLTEKEIADIFIARKADNCNNTSVAHVFSEEIKVANGQ